MKSLLALVVATCVFGATVGYLLTLLSLAVMKEFQ